MISCVWVTWALQQKSAPIKQIINCSNQPHHITGYNRKTAPASTTYTQQQLKTFKPKVWVAMTIGFDKVTPRLSPMKSWGAANKTIKTPQRPHYSQYIVVLGNAAR